ncbi:MAG: SDR family oxidoreductase [Pseudomonadota bacterium]
MPKTVLITGANRGIGLGLATTFARHGWHVIAACRSPDRADGLNALCGVRPGLITLQALDVASPDSIAALADRLEGQPIDVCLNNAGIFGPRNDTATDLSERLSGQLFGDVDYAAWSDVITVNAFGPLRLAEALHENIAKSAQKAFVYISSTVGSIAHTLSSPMPVSPLIYPSSKTLGNAIMAALSKTLKPSGITVVSLCPGHVQTGLGGMNASLTVEESAALLYAKIDGLSPADTGAFFNHQGERVGW